MAMMNGDPYGPDDLAREFRCRHGNVIGRRDAYGTWSGGACWVCIVYGRIRKP